VVSDQSTENEDGTVTGVTTLAQQNVNAITSDVAAIQVTNDLVSYVAAPGGDLSGTVTMDAAASGQTGIVLSGSAAVQQAATNWFAIFLIVCGSLMIATTGLMIKRRELASTVRHLLTLLSRASDLFSTRLLVRGAAIFTATILVFAVIVATGPPINVTISVAVCLAIVAVFFTGIMKNVIDYFRGLTLGLASSAGSFDNHDDRWTGGGSSFGRVHQDRSQRTNTSRMSGLPFFIQGFGHKVQHRTTGQTLTVMHTDTFYTADTSSSSSSVSAGALDVSAKKGA